MIMVPMAGTRGVKQLGDDICIEREFFSKTY